MLVPGNQHIEHKYSVFFNDWIFSVILMAIDVMRVDTSITTSTKDLCVTVLPQHNFSRTYVIIPEVYIVSTSVG